MSIDNLASTGKLRIDSTRNSEYLYAEKPKLSFGQKLGRFFGKALKFLGPIGAAVTSVAVPGLGIPIAAGLYGASNIAGYAVDKAEAKDAAEMQEWQNSKKGMQVTLPGLFDQASEVDIQTSFITPQSMTPQVSNVIVNREMMQNSAVENFNF